RSSRAWGPPARWSTRRALLAPGRPRRPRHRSSRRRWSRSPRRWWPTWRRRGPQTMPKGGLKGERVADVRPDRRPVPDRPPRGGLDRDRALGGRISRGGQWIVEQPDVGACWGRRSGRDGRRCRTGGHGRLSGGTPAGEVAAGGRRPLMTTAQDTARPRTRAGAGGGRIDYKWLASGVVMLGAVMVILDQTVVNVALPSLEADFKVPLSSVQWIVTG